MSGTFDDLFAQVGRGRPVLVGLAKPMALTGGRSLAHYEVVIGLNRSKRLDPVARSRDRAAREYARRLRARMGSDPAGDNRGVSTGGLALRTRALPVSSRSPPLGSPAGASAAGGRSRSPPPTSPPRRCSRARRAGFLLGAATSAHQIEGGTHNDWTEWEKGRYPDGTPHVADGASAARIADSWNLWRSDLAALQLIGANVYRLGVEWSRLEPTPGAWDEAAAARYREMFAGLRAAGITPIVTLYHFTLPTWVAARGGWDWDGAPAALAAFAGRAGAAFGGDVDWWCTINEPNVLVAKSYLAGQWPPGARDPRRAALVLAAMMRAHGLMTRALREQDRADADGDGHATRIGIAQNLRIFDPHSAHPVDGIVAGVADWFYDESFLDAVTLGRIRVVLPGVIDIDEPFPLLAGSFDYLGINYYTRDLIVGQLGGERRTTRSPRRPDSRATISAGRSIPRASTACSCATRAAAGRCS